MIAALNAIGQEVIATEGGFHAVGGCETEIVRIKQIVVHPAHASVHGGLSSPDEQTVAAVRDRIERYHIAQTLLKHQEAGRILSSAIEAVTVATHVVVHAIADNGIGAGAIHADPQSGIEREVVVANVQRV